MAIKRFHCDRGTLRKSNFGAWRLAESWINKNGKKIIVKRTGACFERYDHERMTNDNRS